MAASLGNGHCFQVLPFFALPPAPKGIPDSVAAFVVECGGTRLGTGWFSGVALDMLAVFMVRACNAGGTHQGRALDQSRHKLPQAAEPEVFPGVSTGDSSRCANIAGSRPDSSVGSGAPPDTPAAGGTERGSESGDDEHMQEAEDEVVGEEVWQHVEGCLAAEADKALDIRAALEQRLGEPEARRLLAYTRATVAKQNGHKNRILRNRGTALKLRRACPSFAPVL